MSGLTTSALEFASDSRVSQGSIAISALPRLRDRLYDQAGNANYRITGSCIDGNPNLNISVTGSLNLRCERCLEPFAYVIAISSDLIPVQHTLPDLMDEGEDIESIPAGQNIDVVGLIEEEILLSLPIAPRHEPGVCSASTSVAGKSEQDSMGSGADLGRLRALIKKSK